jgi:hypothetical protein
MITGDHDLHPTRWDIPAHSNVPNVPFQVMAILYKAFSTLNARSPSFADTTRNLTLAPSKMLRALVPIYRADEVIE